MEAEEEIEEEIEVEIEEESNEIFSFDRSFWLYLIKQTIDTIYRLTTIIFCFPI